MLLDCHVFVGCRELGELSVKDNFGMDWASVLEVLPSCKVCVEHMSRIRHVHVITVMMTRSCVLVHLPASVQLAE